MIFQDIRQHKKRSRTRMWYGILGFFMLTVIRILLEVVFRVGTWVNIVFTVIMLPVFIYIAFHAIQHQRFAFKELVTPLKTSRSPMINGRLVSLTRLGIGILIILLGSGISVIMMLHANDDMQRFVFPSTQTVTLPKAGTYEIFNEYQSNVNGRLFSEDQQVAGLWVTVTDMQGNEIPLSTSNSTTSYQFGPYAGVSMFSFHVSHAENVSLRGSYPGGQTEPQVVLSVGENPLKAILPGIILILASIVVGLYIWWGELTLNKLKR